MRGESTCTICHHPLRTQIELAMRRFGASERKVAAEYQVSRDALHRHLVRGHARRFEPARPIVVQAEVVPEPDVSKKIEQSPEQMPPPLREPQTTSQLPPPPPDVLPKLDVDEAQHEYWIERIADTIALGQWNGRETAIAIARKAHVPQRVVHKWAGEAAKRVEAAWGTAKQQRMISLAEWRLQLAKAKEADDQRAAGLIQANIDRLIEAMPARPEEFDDEAAKEHRTEAERRRYLLDLFRLGRFRGLQTAGWLAIVWDDLSFAQLSELVTTVAMELNFVRGSDVARKITLLGAIEQAIQIALRNEDVKGVANLSARWAEIDSLKTEQGLLPAASQMEAMRLIAQELQRFPEAASAVHARLAAEDARKRAVLAPPVIDTADPAAE